MEAAAARESPKKKKTLTQLGRSDYDTTLHCSNLGTETDQRTYKYKSKRNKYTCE